jgi:hypothetical protein
LKRIAGLVCFLECNMVRTDLEQSLHRMSNQIERWLVDIVWLCASEDRMKDVSEIAWSAGRFIESLREIRDGKGGSND